MGGCGRRSITQQQFIVESGARLANKRELEMAHSSDVFQQEPAAATGERPCAFQSATPWNRGWNEGGGIEIIERPAYHRQLGPSDCD